MSFLAFRGGATRALAAWILASAPILGSSPALAEVPEARLLRFPDIHRDFVVFVYGGDIWRAPVAGGEARRLTSHEGLELFPRISPDGAWVAFSAEYSGSRQVWVVPADGGEPRQLTFYGDGGHMPPRGGWDDWIQDWTPDGRILVRMNRTPWGRRMGRYYLVDPAGGLEEPLELPEGGSASMSPDGTKLAYCPIQREFRTWKRTRGGRAQDIWIYDLENHRSERLTDDPATDNFPMWAGDTIYFTSDRSQTLNLWAQDLGAKEPRQITTGDTWDVLWPNLGPGAIVFMKGGYLYRLDLATEEVARIPVRIGSDRPATVPSFRDVREFIQTASLSPSGARVVFEARGELFSVPAKDGPTRHLTRTPGTRERAPSWSPDGRWIAYLSDATGEYEIYIRSQDGAGEARQLTRDNEVWLFPPVWSPDSGQIAFGDRRRRLRIVDVDSGTVTEVDRGRRGDITTYRWSPDSRWLVYENSHDSRLDGFWLYSLQEQRTYALGDGLTNDFSPAWSADGKRLFFLSNRDYQIRFSSFEFNYLFDRSNRIFVATLDPGASPLFPPKSDEEEGDSGDRGQGASNGQEDRGDDLGKAGGKNRNRGEAEAEGAEIHLDPSGFLVRTISLPGIAAGNYQNLVAGEKALYYLATDDDGATRLMRYDFEKRQEEKVLESVSAFELSGDGSKLLYSTGTSSWGITDAKPNANGEKLDLAGLRVKLDLEAEWRQMFRDGWRITRDWFYDPEMHGYDWQALGERYSELVPYVAHRDDLDFIFGELMGELNAGHTYVQEGDEPRVERVEVGKLGCELELDRESGRFRFARILPGENWHDDWRSPLTEPGVDVRTGQYLLAIDGESLAHPENPYRLLEDKADQPVVLKVADDAAGAGAREVTVRPVRSELNLLYLEWVRGRMALTEKLSNGKVGYLHLPDTAFAGNRMLQKLFYGQANKPALIIDDRYNGGGFIPDRMIEYLTRTTRVYWARRDIEAMRTPNFAHDGPKAMLINGYSSSGGDALPYFFRQSGLGPLIGTRTWGGLIGISGAPLLADGGQVIPPTFRIYDTSGLWTVENVGVKPDIEVIDLPELRIAGGDPSLEKAVEILLAKLEEEPVERPEPPAPPNLSH